MFINLFIIMVLGSLIHVYNMAVISEGTQENVDEIYEKAYWCEEDNRMQKWRLEH